MTYPEKHHGAPRFLFFATEPDFLGEGCNLFAIEEKNLLFHWDDLGSDSTARNLFNCHYRGPALPSILKFTTP
jgi:hypothetical protein